MMDNMDYDMNEETGEITDRKSSFVPRAYCTIPADDRNSRILVFKARRNATSLKNIGDETLQVIGVMAEVGVRSRSNAECQNTYLFTSDGKVYFTQSNGIATSMNELVDIVQGDFERNTTNGYIEIKIESINLSGGRTYKRVELLDI